MKSEIFDSNGKPLIYLITKGEMTAANYAEKKPETLEIIKIAAELKIPLVQIREKHLSAKLLFELTSEAAQITKNSVTKILINDRADVALAAGADGVHLTAKSLSATIIRRNFSEDFIIGVSAHSLEKVREAKLQKADFAVLSPIFYTPNKGAPLGLETLREICAKVKPFPVLALGGIDESNYESVLEISCGFAAIRFLNDAKNLKKLVGRISRKGAKTAKKD
ncbi:MAG: thiamine phosphate synthase [Acidobacteriota bacterium]|nr:thiamine phosphate synthase [Acidobacteriota bacterium]